MNLPRWSEYYLTRDFEAFWKNRLAEERASVCVILGVGFDPRSLEVLERIAQCADPQQINYLVMFLRPPNVAGESAQRLGELTQENRRRLLALNLQCLQQSEIDLRDESGHLVGGRQAVQEIHKCFSQIANFRDVVIDISGLPRSFFFAMIPFLCNRADQGKIQNLHISVTEDAAVDGTIRGSEYGEADLLYPFKLQQGEKLVWVPVIGKSEAERLEKIHNRIDGDCIEICPILPFPASNLRRADDLLVQLRETLFERMAVSMDNLLLCDERTPFDIYRKIVKMDEYYRERLKTLPNLGDVTTIVSPLASKMLSLGALLAAIERNLPVAYVEAGSYDIDISHTENASSSPSTTAVEIWLTGEPYNSI